MAKPVKTLDKKKTKKEGDHTRCPLRELLTRLGDKWSILVIHTLAFAPDMRLRFSQLMKAIPGISQRMLTATVRNLERDGILKRHIFPEIPPRVEYELTPLGKKLLAPVEAFVTWIEGNWAGIEKAREDFDNTHPK
jgi:DNA-binding HxlR family transcriptional regulator